MLPLISGISEILAILKNPLRLKILFFLSQGGKTYSELLREVTEDSGKFAFHLRSMKDFFVVEEGIYRLSPMGERLYRFLEGLEEVLMVIYAKPNVEIFVEKDGSARIIARVEYSSPSRTIIGDIFSYVVPARGFIELFIEKKIQEILGSEARAKIEHLDFVEGKLMAQARIEVEHYAKREGTWRIHYTFSRLFSEFQDIPWGIEGNVCVTLNLPQRSRIVRRTEDMELCGEGYGITFKASFEGEKIHVHGQFYKKKGIFVPQHVLDNLLIDLEYEVME